jgi:hypothetical protein
MKNRLVFGALAIGVVTSCSHTDPTQYTTTVIDENRVHIKDAVIVPIIKTSKRLSFGPDGKGVTSSPSGVMAKPFRWNSGDDLVPERFKSSGVMFFPMAVAAKDITIEGWLLLKKNYQPLVISNNSESRYRIGGYQHYIGDSASDYRPATRIVPQKARKEAMSKAPRFVLRRTEEAERKRIIRMLISTPPDRRGLSEFLGIQIERLNLGVSGRKLIKAQE